MTTIPLLDTQALLTLSRVDAQQSLRYYRIALAMPANALSVRLTFTQTSLGHAQIPVALFDSEGHVRLMKASEGTVGVGVRSFHIAPDTASEGCIPGALPPGGWKLLLYKRRILEDVAVRVRVEADIADSAAEYLALLPETSPAVQALESDPFSSRILSQTPGWYCGELHSHSMESTGHTPVEAIQEAAWVENLDFVAVTDHFTASHWLKLQALNTTTRPLFLQSMEVSADFGHANVHGLHEWVLPLVDDNIELTEFLGLPRRPSMEQIADQVHAQGGLMCVNHALSGIFGWRYREFPMEKADLYEIVCLPELETSFLYTTQWDHYLSEGLRLTGVASSDSHHPTKEGPWKFGQVRTWVYAEVLSQAAILEGLRRGHAYASWGKSRLRFHASCGGAAAEMGDTLPVSPGEEAAFSLELLDHPDGNLFLFSDSLIVNVIPFPAAARSEYTFTLPHDTLRQGRDSYVRMEFHEELTPATFYGMAFRNHLSPRLISNPIWLRRA